MFLFPHSLCLLFFLIHSSVIPSISMFPVLCRNIDIPVLNIYVHRSTVLWIISMFTWWTRDVAPALMSWFFKWGEDSLQTSKTPKICNLKPCKWARHCLFNSNCKYPSNLLLLQYQVLLMSPYCPLNQVYNIFLVMKGLYELVNKKKKKTNASRFAHTLCWTSW